MKRAHMNIPNTAMAGIHLKSDLSFSANEATISLLRTTSVASVKLLTRTSSLLPSAKESFSTHMYAWYDLNCSTSKGRDVSMTRSDVMLSSKYSLRSEGTGTT